MRVLPAIGVRSVLPVLPLGKGVVEDFLGEDEPNPTGVRMEDDRPPAPDRILDERRTELPLGESSEFKEMFDPVRDGGLEPLRDPGAADVRLLVKLICSSA